MIKFLFLNKKYILNEQQKATFIHNPKIKYGNGTKEGIWIPKVLIENSKFPNQFLIKIYKNNTYNIVNYETGTVVLVEKIDGNDLITAYENLKIENKINFKNEITSNSLDTNNYLKNIIPQWLKEKEH